MAGNQLQTRTMTVTVCTKRFIAASSILVLQACGVLGTADWKHDPQSDSLLQGETSVSGFSIKPPANFYSYKSRDGQRDITFHNYTDCLEGSKYTGGNMVSAGKPRQDIDYYIWWDSRPPEVQKTEPIYKGASEMCQTSTDVLQRSLKIVAKTASGPNSDDNLRALIKDHLDRGKPVGFDLKKTDIEFGNINGQRFARQRWTTPLSVSKRYPMVNTSENVDSEGFLYVTINDGQALSFLGTAPKGESMQDIEEAVLTFHK